MLKPSKDDPNFAQESARHNTEKGASWGGDIDRYKTEKQKEAEKSGTPVKG